MRAKRARASEGPFALLGRLRSGPLFTGLLLLAVAVACSSTDAQACNAFLHDGSQCKGSNPGCDGFCSFNELNQQVCFYYPFKGNACDDGNASTVNDQCDDSGNCFGTLCGNNVLDGGEQCDDGAANGTATSCCAANCAFQSAGTACDDGDASTVADKCNGGATCAGSLCGNGAADAGEVCDEGAANGTSASCCSVSCTFSSQGTACDDGDASTAHDQCDGSGACAGVPCGNGSLDTGEDCDDGAANGTSASCCSAACSFQPASTACDDADASTVDDQCDGAGSCAGSTCGNDTKDAGEDCDDGAANGTLASCCSAGCTFKATSTTCDDADASTVGDRCDGAGSCAGVLCGNDAEDAGEDCDDGAANGTLASCCTASCKLKSANAACDDGDAGTTNDRCSASGVCDGDVELVDNGGFEGGATAGIANGWLAKRLAMPPDRVGCTPNCFVELFGDKTIKKYYQYYETPGSAGDSFTLKARSRARGVPAAGGSYAVEATIFNADHSTQSFRLSFSAGLHPYETATGDFVASKSYDKIRITIVYGKAAGRVRFDDVSLLLH